MISSEAAVLRNLLTGGNKAEDRHFSHLEIERLTAYYKVVLKWNPLLNLTTLTRPEEFWHRHLLESVWLAQKLSPRIEEVWDLGSGLGVPGIPLAVLRPDLRVKLVEAQRKKAIFLEEAAALLKFSQVVIENTRLENRQFLPERTALIARAVDKMSEILPHLFRLAEQAEQVLLLGTGELAKRVEHLVAANWRIQLHPLPNSHERLLLLLERST